MCSNNWAKPRLKATELDITGQVLPGFNVNVNGAITDAKITKESPNVVAGKETVGNITPNTAKYIFNSWLQYNAQKGFLKNFGVQGGAQWQAERTVGTSGVSNIPNYFRLDGGINYHTGKLSIGFLVNNLLDDHQLLTSASMSATLYTYIVEARRNFRSTITYRF
ncbi:TonB-dependent receptor [Chitinophaga sedimenti]|uniref:type IX secretion system membrane protein PorP/SprF n=1 Tax=Chitinophaga sedimenti TaxID=2033606 RepID=UPI0020054B89|nr:type IX secretion system membrane protein PorP/SprF [Chitinophaga sedimenti]MCK7553933.1 TonB-dependent receptor [Chitinophaga sedimenti]